MSQWLSKRKNMKMEAIFKTQEKKIQKFLLYTHLQLT